MIKNLQYILFSFIIALLSSNITEGNAFYNEPENLSILNSEGDEFAPAWNRFEGKLYFTSDRSGYEKFYISELDAENDFKNPEYLKQPINETNKNVSYISFDNPEQIYFSSYVKGGFQPILQLFYSNFRKQAWSEGFPQSDLRSERFTGHPTISPNSKQMIFVSQSDEGDLDLYISYRMEDGSWRTPNSLENLNSRGDEISPYLASNDTLYFASKGQGGPGGFDIFISLKQDGIWQQPIPMYELNSEYNESDICVLPNGDLVFASDRPGGKGGLDLWISKINADRKEVHTKSEMEINLKSYVNSIIVKNDFEYLNLPVSPFLYLDNARDTLSSKFFEKVATTEIQDIDKIDDSYYLTLNVVGERMQKIRDATLSIIAKIPNEIEFEKSDHEAKNSKFYADLNITEIKGFLIDAYSIDESRIDYSYEFYKNNESDNPLIELYSKENRLFEQIQIRDDNISLSPNSLAIDVEITPGDILKNWTAYLQYNDVSKEVYQNYKASDRVTINLNNLKNIMFDLDKLSVKITAEKSNSNVINKEITYLIDKRSTRKPKLIDEGGRLFEYHYFFLGNDTNINSPVFNGTLNRLFNAILVCNGVEVFYNKGNSVAKKFSENLKKELDKRITTDTGVEILSTDLGNDLKLKNMVKVKIEKFPVKN